MEHHEIAVDIGIRIKGIREQRNLSQLDLASLCNMDRTNISRIESGKTNLTLKSMVIICNALEIDIKELF